jgi:glycosyltransferase involved in cell wall biosynthesis
LTEAADPEGALGGARASHRWTINGRFLTQRVTGVQRYAGEVVAALDELVAARHPLAQGLELEVLTPRGARSPFPLRAIPVREKGSLTGHAWEQITLPRHARGGILNLCNTAPMWRLKQIVCIHDANVFVCPESYSAKFRAAYRLLLPLLGRLARVVTVSRFSAEQLDRFKIAPRGKITVIPNGRDHALRWQPTHSPATQAASGPGTVVLIGSMAPHKNTPIVLGIADELAAAGVRIAVVGRIDPRVFAGAGRGDLPANIAQLGPISDAELAAILSDCLCLAFPSLTEGFGLPPLEAMALGCPVVSSDRASMPEVCADAALYASPTEPAAWRDAILKLREDPALRSDLAERGRRRSAQFTWKVAAERYLEMMSGVQSMAADATSPHA